MKFLPSTDYQIPSDMNGVQLRIRGLAKEMGLSLSEFAKKIGTHQSSLSRSLAEGNNVGDAMLNKISIAFDINKTWLLTGEGEKLNEKKSYKRRGFCICILSLISNISIKSWDSCELLRLSQFHLYISLNQNLPTPDRSYDYRS